MNAPISDSAIVCIVGLALLLAFLVGAALGWVVGKYATRSRTPARFKSWTPGN